MSSIIEIINGIAIRWSDGMWLIIWQSAVLAAIIYVVTMLIRRASAATCFWLWMLVPLRLLVMPLITISLPLLPATAPEPEGMNVGLLSAEVAVVNPAGAVPSEQRLGLEKSESMVSPTSGTGSIDRPTLPSVWTLLMTGWLAGLALCSTRLFRDWRRVMHISDEAIEATEGGVLESAQRAGTTLGLKRMPKVLITKERISPFLFGVFKPVLVVPEGLIANVRAEELIAVFAHEFAHLRRRDPLIGWLLAICEAVYFFNPIFYFVKRRILFERERACDSWVVTSSKARSSVYANALISAADICRGFRANIGPVGAVAESFGDLKKRLTAISRNLKPKARLSISALILLVILSAVCAPGILLTARAEEHAEVKPKKRVGTPLHQAAKDGDVEKVRLLISQGADIHALNVSLNPPLCAAVESGNMEIVKLLVEAGADVNAGSWSPLFTAVDNDRVAIAEYLIAHGADKHGDDYWTVLMEAFGESSIEMVKLLIAKGADIHFKSVELNGWTALHSAVGKGYKEIAELLIQKGVDVNAGPWTPLHEAARSRNRDIAELLIQNGADVNAKDHKSETPLYTAIRKKDLGVTQLLISKGANLKVKNNNGYTPLCEAPFAGKDILDLILAKGEYPDTINLAACKGDLNGVKTWVDRGTDVNRKDEFGLSPLHWAVSVGSRDVTDYLIDVSANPNVKDNKQGATPLMLAHDALLAERLISKGADVRLKSQTGTTALHIACIFGIKDLAELLIRSGADINARDNYGATPLFRAAGGGYVGVIELLIEKGADVNLALNEGATPISMANQRSNAEVVAILRQHGAKETLHGAVASGDIEGVKRLIAQGADLNARNEKGQTPLHLSFTSRYGRSTTVLLISEGADVNAKDQAGETPLMMAAALGRLYQAEVLITQGADVNAKANNGETALLLAKEKGKTEMVELLRKYGAKESDLATQPQGPIKKPQENEQSLEMAISSNNLEKVKELIGQGVDLNVRDDRGDTPLFQAVKANRVLLVEALISGGADVNTRGGRGGTLLHPAALRGDKDIVELLIASGVDVNAKASRGLTPLDLAKRRGNVEIIEVLTKAMQDQTNVEKSPSKNESAAGQEEPGSVKSIHEAAANGDVALVKKLIAEGADVNATEGNKAWPPLFSAVRGSHPEVVKILLANGANVNIAETWGYTAVYYAIWNDDEKTVKALISAGLDVNKGPGNEKDEYPPLCYAIWQGHAGIVKDLLDAGADINTKDGKGYTPLYWAAFSSEKEVFDLILSRGDWPDTIHLAAYKGDLDRVRTRIEDGTDVDVKDAFDCTLLHWAVLADSPDVAAFLIGKGADVNAKHGRGYTPLMSARLLPVVELLVANGADIHARLGGQGPTKLHMACTAGDKDLVEFVLRQGADVNLKLRDGRTPLMQAAREGHTDIVKLLIAHSAVVNVSDNRGRTALALAEQRNHTEIVELLKKHGAKE
jgi:ankyrin repeat protein/beta-lactamase regulating signal transducer with metallopeptidase domain